MFVYWIAGVPSCPDFGHAKLIAEKLKHSLPHFSYRIIVKTKEEYQNWQREFCLEQKWKIDKNPLIWKRTSNSSNRCHLIGGINEFFEQLTEYYNIDTRLDKKLKKHIALDNQERMQFMLTEQVPVQRATPRKVCITGAVYPSTSFLVSELLQLDQLHTKGGITICLHHKDTNKYGDLIRIKNEMSDAEFNVRGYGAVLVVNSVEEGLLKCDILIVIGDVKRGDREDQHQWTNRNYVAMKSLASILNRHCPNNCKVLLTGCEGLLCFNLSVLAEFADKVYLYNIVGVTGHHGMETLPTISRATGIPVSNLHCPPVWGFVGSAKYIDVNHVVYANRACGDTTEHGFVNRNNHKKYLRSVLLRKPTDFRNLHNLVNSNKCVSANAVSVKTECPLSCLPEVRATIKLITEWFAKTENNVSISAAIFSDGTFGLPFGMFMSQPVCMNNSEWKPNYNFPAIDEIVLTDIVSKVKDLLVEYNLGKRFNMNWKESMSQISEQYM